MKLVYVVYCLLLSLFLFSCDLIFFDPVTEIEVVNNSNHTVLLEYKTVYDSMPSRFEEDNEVVYSVNRGFLGVTRTPLEIKPKETVAIIGMVGVDILVELDLGTIQSIDDVIHAIDYIFSEIYVFRVSGEEKKLLYEKDYFLDKQNIQVKNRFVSIIIKPEV